MYVMVHQINFLMMACESLAKLKAAQLRQARKKAL